MKRRTLLRVLAVGGAGTLLGCGEDESQSVKDAIADNIRRDPREYKYLKILGIPPSEQIKIDESTITDIVYYNLPHAKLTLRPPNASYPLKTYIDGPFDQESVKGHHCDGRVDILRIWEKLGWPTREYKFFDGSPHDEYFNSEVETIINSALSQFRTMVENLPKGAWIHNRDTLIQAAQKADLRADDPDFYRHPIYHRKRALENTIFVIGLNNEWKDDHYEFIMGQSPNGTMELKSKWGDATTSYCLWITTKIGAPHGQELSRHLIDVDKMIAKNYHQTNKS